MGAFLFLAYAAAPQFKEFKVQIWLLCTAYAVLQLPAYINILIDPTPDLNERKLLEGLLASGKIMFVLLFFFILLVETKIAERAGIIKLFNYVLSGLNAILLGLTLISTITQLLS